MNSNHENESELNNNSKIYNYISVIFENRYYPFDDDRILNDASFRNEIYGNATKYTYKTDKIFAMGQVLTIESLSGNCRVLVVNPSLLKENINFPIDKVKELPLVE